jgi:CheY-like chemotaxis protein
MMRASILFVEDEPEYFRPLIEALRETYDLHLVTDATQALEELSATEFSLLIVDIMLAKGSDPSLRPLDALRSGLYLIRLVRRLEQLAGVGIRCRADVPILCPTAVSDLTLEGELQDLRCVLVHKPFGKRDVLPVIDHLLTGVATIPWREAY